MSWSTELAMRLDVILFRLEMLARAARLPCGPQKVANFVDASHSAASVEGLYGFNASERV